MTGERKGVKKGRDRKAGHSARIIRKGSFADDRPASDPESYIVG